MKPSEELLSTQQLKAIELIDSDGGVKDMSRTADIQWAFAECFIDFPRARVDETYRRQQVLHQVTCMQVELAELVESLNWKSWLDKGGDDWDNATVEAVDLLCFLLNILRLLGEDSSRDIAYRHYTKVLENFKRQLHGRDDDNLHRLSVGSTSNA